MFKIIRVIILLLILASVWTTVAIQRTVVQDWQGTLDIKIIPVIADDRPTTRKFVEKIDERYFRNIKRYLEAQAKKYDVNLENNLNIEITEAISDVPPTVPENGASRFDIIIWSLKLRWWAWQHQLDDHHIAQIRLYVLYQSPSDRTPLAHSTGLQNGLIGLINTRANRQNISLHQVTSYTTSKPTI